MPIQIFWCSDIPNLQVYQIIQKWTLDEVYGALRDGYVMSKDLEEFIILYDLSMAQGIPNNFLFAINHMTKLHQANVSMRVIVSKCRFVKTMYALIVKIQPKLGEKITFLDSLDEALPRIRHFRDNNPSN